ncbi:MAG: hypothetical protein E7517_08540 [Ruminococcaceae bacterium]|nr:hypothetical protein [Oscillospiraceae bacterium]
MSMKGRLLSAALTAGAALAIGYGMKKLGEKAQEPLAAPQDDAQADILGTADSKIRLKMGDKSDWSYTMRSKGIVKEKENTVAGKEQHFDFVPLKDGVTQLEFDYKPQQAAGAKTITYNIEVKGGKIIRCDAAGDLEMIAK